MGARGSDYAKEDPKKCRSLRYPEAKELSRTSPLPDFGHEFPYDKRVSESPLVSVLVSNYNYEHFLEEAVDSALKQTYSKLEVVVVDDGSTDGSRELIESYGDRVIPVLKENGGQASACNAGFRASKGEIVIFLDADDVLLPDTVGKVVAA